jgi:hypothetical protein
MDAEIKREFERLHQKINTLLSEAKKETWIKAHDIMKITVWGDREKLRRAKVLGYVEQKKDKKMGIVYKLESINPHFLKNKTA